MTIPLLYAHRGAHRRFPENTLAAFRAAIEQGADGVELDVRPCASGELVVAHDPTLERVAGRPESVHALGLPRLQEIDLGAEARIPLLDDAADLLLGAGLRMNVEIKGDVPDRLSAARSVARFVARRCRSERDSILLSTFDPLVLTALRVFVRDVRMGYLFDEAHTGARRAAIVIAVLRPEGLHPHHPFCTRARVRRWRRRERFINAWTVNDPNEAKRLAALGVDGLITDDVPVLRSAF